MAIYTSTQIIGSSMILSSGDIASSMTVADGGSVSVYSGGTANYTTVNSWGSLSVFSGGTANNTTINNGYMDINSGGTANNTTINRGYMDINSGGTANNTTVNSGGWMMINRGGKATNIIADSGAGLLITVAPDTYIQGTSAGSAFEMKDGHINGYKIADRCEMFVESGGVASNTYIQQGGWMEINNGGVANHTTVNSDNSSGGGMYINNGGVANHTTVSSGGYMRLLGKHGGKLNILSGATVHVFSETIIDFTVAGQTPGDVALITNWNLISGAPVYTMTVNANQAAGNYLLATGTASFNNAITVKTDKDVELGSLSVGTSLTRGNYTYTLRVFTGICG